MRKVSADPGSIILVPGGTIRKAFVAGGWLRSAPARSRIPRTTPQGAADLCRPDHCRPYHTAHGHAQPVVPSASRIGCRSGIRGDLDALCDQAGRKQERSAS